MIRYTPTLQVSCARNHLVRLIGLHVDVTKSSTDGFDAKNNCMFFLRWKVFQKDIFDVFFDLFVSIHWIISMR